jgi:hypothetical protein
VSGVTWSKFYWSDWASDPKLKLCSLAAQGLWMQMLCIAAQNDPIGYLSVADRPLGVTDLARLIGASETELGVTLEELDRNRVFSRDRNGRIYSRRLVADAKKSAEFQKWGKLGGNPTLGKGSGKPPRVNPTLKGHDKPQQPSARPKVETPNSVSNLGEAKNDFIGPKEVRDAFVTAKGEAWCVSYLDRCGWQDVPDRALIPVTRTAGSQLIREGRAVLSALGLIVIERAA